jgi:hypothetical protein
MERTVQEIQASLTAFQEHLETSNAAFEAKLEQFVLRAVYEAHNTLLDLRLTDMESKFDARLRLVERVVFGAIGLICTAVLVALIALVVNKGGSLPTGAP